MLGAGSLMFMFGLAILSFVVGYWSKHHYSAIGNVLPAVVGTTLVVVGAQNALGGFLLAIISGNEAKFLKEEGAYRSSGASPSRTVNPLLLPQSGRAATSAGRARSKI